MYQSNPYVNPFKIYCPTLTAPSFINSPPQQIVRPPQGYKSQTSTNGFMTQPTATITQSLLQRSPKAAIRVKQLESNLVNDITQHTNQPAEPRHQATLKQTKPTNISMQPTLTIYNPNMESRKDLGASIKPSKINLYAIKSSKECSVGWQLPSLPSHLAISCIIKVYENDKIFVEANLYRNISECSFTTRPGEWYMCEYIIDDSRGINMAKGSICFRATFSKKEMNELYQKSVSYCGASHPDMRQFKRLYRCKPHSYWFETLARPGIIMKKYMKDENGQAANPINGIIEGLFFSAKLLDNGTFPPKSPFGDIRMTIPAENLLNPEKVNTYFSDFYCNNAIHYVTLVICVKGSPYDSYCSDNLVLLSSNNPFLRVFPTNRIDSI